jgi:hypothetical protein
MYSSVSTHLFKNDKKEQVPRQGVNTSTRWLLAHALSNQQP